MQWDAHAGKWVSGDGSKDSASAAGGGAQQQQQQGAEPPGALSPTRRPRATSPARLPLSSAVPLSQPTAATAGAPNAGGGGTSSTSSGASRRRAAGPVDDGAVNSTPVDDPDLPGWLVLQRTTNTGRSYKVGVRRSMRRSMRMRARARA